MGFHKHLLSFNFMPRGPAVFVVACLILAAGSTTESWAGSDEASLKTEGPLSHLSLEQLGNTEVTTVSKEPTRIIRTPAAIYVLTQEDIRRSGATSIPEVLRLVPGVEGAFLAVAAGVGESGFYAKRFPLLRFQTSWR